MYVILVNNDNTLSAPKKQRIMQRSKLVDTFWFLVHPIYNNIDLTDCKVLLEYLTPVSRQYKTEILKLSEEKYEDHLKYLLPIDTELTAEAGEIELQLTFAKAEFDANGNFFTPVRKTDSINVNVFPINKWADIIPDEALNSIDQRLIKMDAQIRALDDLNTLTYMTKADNLVYEDNKLQLTANGKKIGDPVDIQECDDCDEDGVPVVDFSNSSDFVTPDDSVDTDNEGNLNDNVVEFDPLQNKNLNNVIEF